MIAGERAVKRSPSTIAARIGLRGGAPARAGQETRSSTAIGKWKGKKIVLAMLYPKCTSACPFIVEKLKKIQKKLDAEGTKAEFVLVSLDTEEESTDRLQMYRKHMGLTAENWHFLFGKEKEVRTFSNLIHVRYWRNPKSKDINHDNVVLLLDEKGATARRLEGLDAPVDKLFAEK